MPDEPMVTIQLRIRADRLREVQERADRNLRSRNSELLTLIHDSLDRGRSRRGEAA